MISQNTKGAANVYNELKQVKFSDDDSRNPNTWSGMDQINSYVNQAIEDRLAYYIGPNNFAFNNEESIKSIAKHICERICKDGDTVTDYKSDRPVIVISNTATVLAESSTDASKQGGYHWIGWVLLPKQYHSLSGREISNDKYQVFFFDSLGHASFPKSLKDFLVKGGEITEKTDKGKEQIRLIPFCKREEIDFIDLNDLTGHQVNGSDCGWWVVYYVLMTVYTGGVEFLEPLKGKKLSANSLRSVMDLSESTEQSSIKSISVCGIGNPVEKGSTELCAHESVEKREKLPCNEENRVRKKQPRLPESESEDPTYKVDEKRLRNNEENRVRKNPPRLCNTSKPPIYSYPDSSSSEDLDHEVYKKKVRNKIKRKSDVDKQSEVDLLSRGMGNLNIVAEGSTELGVHKSAKKSEDLSHEVDKKKVRNKIKRKSDVDKQSEVDDSSKGIKDKLILYENQYGIRGAETSEHRGNSKKSTFSKNVGLRERNRKKNGRSSLSSISFDDCRDKIVKAIAGRSEKSKNLLMGFFQKKDGRNMLLNVHKAGLRVRQSMSSILTQARTGGVAAFEELYKLWFDKKGNKKHCLKKLENQGVPLSNISSILNKAKSGAPDAFIGLHNLLFTKGYLGCIRKQGINLSNISSILHGAGAKAPGAFKGLYKLWFDEEGNKKHCLETLEAQKIDLKHVSSILNGAGAKAATAFKGLYEFFSSDEGKKAVEYFNEAGFTNLSAMVGGSGANFKQSIIDLEQALFDRCGNQKPLLEHFLKSGFTTSNLSDALCHSGDCAARYLIKFHDYCFDEKGNQKKQLQDLFNKGFSQSNLCMIISGRAGSLGEFYKFCFCGKGEEYLSHLLGKEEGFSCNQLSSILHGVGGHVYSALKNSITFVFSLMEEQQNI